MRNCLNASLLVAALVLAAAPTIGQTPSERVVACSVQGQNFCAEKETVLLLQGYVVSNDSRIADAVVVLQEKSNPADPFTTVSDELGRFAFLGLKGGQYVLRVAHQGYEEVTQAVELFAGTTVTLKKPINLTKIPASRANPPVSPPVKHVFYVTDRMLNKQCKEGACYWNRRAERGQMSYGHTDLTVPDTAPGSITLNHTYVDTDEQAFLENLKREGQDALVFVHGFDNSFESGIRELAALAHDLRFEGPAILFSWASRDLLDSYFEDESTIDWSAPHFRKFLRDLRGYGFERINLVAHSMGNRLLLRWLEEGQGAKHEGQTVFVAPDVDVDTFQEAVSAASGITDHLTMYASQWDQALLLSETIHRHPRAGLLKRGVIQGLDVIDVSGVDATFTHHSYLVGSTILEDDIAALLSKNYPPRKHLQRVGQVWELKTN
jgi:esterase/lipase superfamily enzyme